EMPSARMDERFNTMMEAVESGVKKGRSQISLYQRFNEFISTILPKTPALQFALIAVIFISGILIGGRKQGGEDVIRNSELAQMRADIQNTNQLVMLSLVNQASTSERIKSIMKFASYDRLSEEAINTLITVLNNDPDTNVRLESIEVLNKFIDKQFVKDNLLIALQSQEDPFVQIALIEMFVMENEKKAADIFRAMLQKNGLNTLVKERLEEGIEYIS
ncbi:HEAT repeat domain-containing protein, partial [candidate division KSB1 bacterium]